MGVERGTIARGLREKFVSVFKTDGQGFAKELRAEVGRFLRSGNAASLISVTVGLFWPITH
jgi:hypothetical protein